MKIVSGRDFFLYRVSKGWQALPALVSRPSRIPWLFHGVSPGRLLALDVGWLQRANIRTVLDVGANVGQFAQAIHHLLPNATIHSFEPLPDCYEAMLKRMGGVHKFHAYNLAIGEEKQIAEFQRNEFTQSSSMLRMAGLHKDAFSWSARATTVEVNVCPLDSVLEATELEPRILVKIDVQGFEDRVLRGGERILRSAHIAMVETSFEALYEGQASFANVYELMKEYGFEYKGNVDQLQSPLDGKILQADALFIRRET